MSRRVSIAALCLALALTAVAKEEEPPGVSRTIPGFYPDLEHSTCLMEQDGAWTLPVENVLVRFTPLTGDERRRYLEEVVGTATDPFLARPDTQGFNTFLIQLENRGGQSLLFDPAKCWQQARSKRIWLPLDLPEMMEAYRLIEAEFPPAYEKAAEALVQLPVYLDPGQRKQGLMIYPGVPEKTKSFHIDLEISDTRGEKIDCKLFYKKEKKKKNGNEK